MLWSFSVFRNSFVKEGGLWKLKDLSITPLITANWADGWGKGGIGPQVHYEYAGVPRHLTQDTAGRRGCLASPTSRAGSPAHTPGTDWRTSTTLNGIFFDASLDCGQLGQIDATQGFKESPFQGFFRTPVRVAEVCRVAWGAKQPEMRPEHSVHRQPQPVILVCMMAARHDLDSRLFQPGTSRNFARGFAGAIYNSQFCTGRSHLQVLGHHD